MTAIAGKALISGLFERIKDCENGLIEAHELINNQEFDEFDELDGKVINYLLSESQHFSKIIYSDDNPLEKSISFSEWLTMTTSNRIKHLLKGLNGKEESLMNFLIKYILPLKQLHELKSSQISNGDIIECLKNSLSLPNETVMLFLDNNENDHNDLSFEECLKSELLNRLIPDYYPINWIVEIVRSCNVTTPLNFRCFESSSILAKFIIEILYEMNLPSNLSDVWTIIKATITCISENILDDGLYDHLIEFQSAISLVETLRDYNISIDYFGILIKTFDCKPTIALKRYDFIRCQVSECLHFIDFSGLNENSIPNLVTIGQAIAIKICYIHCSAYRVGADYSKLFADLSEHFPSKLFSVDKTWLSDVLVRTLGHFEALDILKSAFVGLTNPIEITNDSAGYLIDIGVTADNLANELLSKSKEIINSCSSCYDSEIDLSKDLVIVIADALDNNSGWRGDSQLIERLRCERSIHNVVLFLQALDVDMIPIKIRLIDPLELCYKILSDRPKACETAEPLALLKSKSTNREKSRVYGEAFVQLLTQLSSDLSHHTDIERQLFVIVLNHVISRKDFISSYQIALWFFDNFVSLSDVEINIINKLVRNIQAFDSRIVDLRRQLLSNLSNRLDLNRYFDLIVEHKEADDIPADLFYRGRELIEKALSIYLQENNRVVILHPVKSTSELLEIANADDLINEAIICFSEVSSTNVSAICEFLQSRMNEYHDKLSYTASSNSCSSIEVDNEVVKQLLKKGFSYNGSRRAIIATGGRGSAQALAWAIDHCNDQDFDNPMAIVTADALNNSDGSSLNKQVLMKAISAISFVASRCGIELSNYKNVDDASDQSKIESVTQTDIKTDANVIRLKNALDVAQDFLPEIIIDSNGLSNFLTNVDSASDSRNIAILTDVFTKLSKHREVQAFVFANHLQSLIFQPFRQQLSFSLCERELVNSADEYVDLLVVLLFIRYTTYINETSLIEYALSSLRTIPGIFAKLLSDRYMKCDGSNVFILTSLKSEACNLLNDLNESELIGLAKLSDSSEDLREQLHKQMQDDIATLRRISRVPDSTGINARSLLATDLLFSLPDSSEKSTPNRTDAVKSLLPYLFPHNVTTWLRAIGRVLLLGPAELHFYCAVSRLMESPDSLSDSDLKSLLVKMKSAQIKQLSLLIFGNRRDSSNVALEADVNLCVSVLRAIKLLSLIEDVISCIDTVDTTASLSRSKFTIVKRSSGESSQQVIDNDLVSLIRKMREYLETLVDLPESVSYQCRMNYNFSENSNQFVELSTHLLVTSDLVNELAINKLRLLVHESIDHKDMLVDVIEHLLSLQLLSNNFMDVALRIIARSYDCLSDENFQLKLTNRVIDQIDRHIESVDTNLSIISMYLILISDIMIYLKIDLSARFINTLIRIKCLYLTVQLTDLFQPYKSLCELAVDTTSRLRLRATDSLELVLILTDNVIDNVDLWSIGEKRVEIINKLSNLLRVSKSFFVDTTRSSSRFDSLLDVWTDEKICRNANLTDRFARVLSIAISLELVDLVVDILVLLIKITEINSDEFKSFGSNVIGNLIINKIYKNCCEHSITLIIRLIFQIDVLETLKEINDLIEGSLIDEKHLKLIITVIVIIINNNSIIKLIDLIKYTHLYNYMVYQLESIHNKRCQYQHNRNLNEWITIKGFSCHILCKLIDTSRQKDTYTSILINCHLLNYFSISSFANNEVAVEGFEIVFPLPYELSIIFLSQRLAMEGLVVESCYLMWLHLRRPMTLLRDDKVIEFTKTNANKRLLPNGYSLIEVNERHLGWNKFYSHCEVISQLYS